MSPEKQTVLVELDEVIRRAQGLPFVVPDDTGFFAVDSSMILGVRDIIEAALAIMRQAQELYDEEKSSDSSEPILSPGIREDDFLREIGAAISSELAAQEVSNIAFAVRAQLMETYSALVNASRGDQLWVVASYADTGLRRAGKGLITLESAIREYEGLDPVERTWSRLQDSLEIRRLYSQFRRGVAKLGRPEGAEQLHTALRSAATRIAILRDRKIYPLMRISDRLPIRRLQKRILEWLKTGGGTEHEESGRRLWSDLLSFAELLVQVNHREELRDNDRRVIQEWLERHFADGDDKMPPRPAAPEHLADLESLIGRSDHLDEMLLSPSDCTLESLRIPLRHMFQELNRPYEAVETPLTSLS